MVPDRVKFALTSTARPVAGADANTVGSGEIDVNAATFTAPPGVANIGVVRSNGTGSIDLSRGSVDVQFSDPYQTVVNGTLTAQLLLFSPLAYTTGEWGGSQWYGSQWYGSQWYGSQWYGSQWYGSQWYGSQWYGQTDSTDWYGSQWYGSQWYGVWE